MSAESDALREPGVSRMTTALSGLLLVCVMSSCSVESDDSVEGVGAEFQPYRVLDPFPPIQNVPLLTVDAVDYEVTSNELVIGVVVNDEARAYPINMLNGPQREIINDQLGGQSIAATW